MEELAMTLESAAEVDSIYKIVYQGDGTDLQLVDRLPEKEDRHEKLFEPDFSGGNSGKIGRRGEKTDCISVFSGYDPDRGCKKMGMSQVQISRMEKRILKKLREIQSHKRYDAVFVQKACHKIRECGKGEKKSCMEAFSHIFRALLLFYLEFNFLPFQSPLSELCRSREAGQKKS